MKLLENIRKKFMENPNFEKKFHGIATIAWFVLAFPICIFLSESIPLLVFISVYAIVISHWSAFQAAKSEES